jgi:hypothetical protein
MNTALQDIATAALVPGRGGEYMPAITTGIRAVLRAAAIR